MSKPPIIPNLPLVPEPPVVGNPKYRLTAKDMGSCADRCYEDKDSANNKADKDYDDTMDEISCRYNGKHTNDTPCDLGRHGSHGKPIYSLFKQVWNQWLFEKRNCGLQNPITFYGTMYLYYCSHGNLDNYPNRPYWDCWDKALERYSERIRRLMENLRKEEADAAIARDLAKSAAWLEFYDCCKTY